MNWEKVAILIQLFCSNKLYKLWSRIYRVVAPLSNLDDARVSEEHAAYYLRCINDREGWGILFP
jgi:hypothetical protein